MKDAKRMSPGEMKFSVVIPLYNKRDSIKRAIESTINQTIPPVEVVIVDDGSTDGSLEHIFAKLGPKVRLVKQPNAGPSAARNHGARLCIGDYLIFLDADEELASSAILEHAKCLSGNARVDVSLASFRKIDANGHTTDGHLTRRVGLGSERFVYLEQFSAACVMGIVTSGICVSRPLFQHLGGFDESLRCWEITDFLMRASLAARMIGLHRNISVTSHESPQNSQFAREQNSPDYRLRFAVKIAQSLPEIPKSAQAAMVKPALDLAYSLWNDGYLLEYKRICSSLSPVLTSEHRRARLYVISQFPQLLLKILYLVHRLIRAAHGDLIAARELGQ
jgi:glycosyltransferase involved in cell wall biosynthesis